MFLCGGSQWVSEMGDLIQCLRLQTQPFFLSSPFSSRASLLGTERLSELSPEQAEFVRTEDGGMSLMEVMQKYKPTMLLGMTAVGGLFKEDLIKEMASHCERPVIFPLSNPTTSAECTAEQAFEWTDGRCIFASGSPFDPVELDDGRVFYPSQCNNSKYNQWVERYIAMQ